MKLLNFILCQCWRLESYPKASAISLLRCTSENFLEVYTAREFVFLFMNFKSGLLDLILLFRFITVCDILVSIVYG